MLRETAARYSGAPDYPEVAKAAILEMFRQTGPCVYDGGGLLTRGVVIRHLLLPGRLSEAKEVMDWVAERFRPGEVLFSLMSQYIPWGRAGEFPELNRRLRPSAPGSTWPPWGWRALFRRTPPPRAPLSPPLI